MNDVAAIKRDLEKNIHTLYPLTLKSGRPISPTPVDAAEYEAVWCPLYENAHREGVSI